MEYKLLDIKEADYGCEEIPEGEEVKCLLVLEEIEPAEFCENRSHNIEVPAKMKDTAVSKKNIEINDSLATKLGLIPGIIISDNELAEMRQGNIPTKWGDIENRHFYDTSIGRVCMSNREFREYKLLHSE